MKPNDLMELLAVLLVGGVAGWLDRVQSLLDVAHGPRSLLPEDAQNAQLTIGGAGRLGCHTQHYDESLRYCQRKPSS